MQPHRIFTADAAEIDFALVRDFLDLSIEEGFTIDYKSTADAAVDTLAAMANTYGGLVLAGVDVDRVHKDRPGAVVGVAPGEKERFVNKVANVLDPPWWCPEVISVPTGDGDKSVLVIRVDADQAPRPILHKGVIRVRLDGRNQVADRRMARALFDETGPAPQQTLYDTPRRWADEYNAARYRLKPPPHVTVRAIASRYFRGGQIGRPRLGGPVAQALMTALADPMSAAHAAPAMRLMALLARGRSGLPIFSWQIDDQHLHSRFLRLVSGHGMLAEPAVPGARIECSVEVKGQDSYVSLEVWVDVHFWIASDDSASDARIPAGDVIQACHEVVGALVQRALPTATEALVGPIMLPLPPIELSIVGNVDPETNNHRPLEDYVRLEDLGQRIGSRPIYRGGEYLRSDLVDAGCWDEAVNDALEVMAMDWQFLNPKL